MSIPNHSIPTSCPHCQSHRLNGTMHGLLHYSLSPSNDFILTGIDHRSDVQFYIYCCDCHWQISIDDPIDLDNITISPTLGTLDTHGTVSHWKDGIDENGKSTDRSHI